MNKKRGVLPYFSLLLLVLLLSGCAGSVTHMRVVSPDKVVTGPEEGKAMVVFMRPSGLGFAIQSSVFEIKANDPKAGRNYSSKEKNNLPA